MVDLSAAAAGRLRGWRFYPRGGLQLGSALVAAVASVWLVERALNVALPVL